MLPVFAFVSAVVSSKSLTNFSSTSSFEGPIADVVLISDTGESLLLVYYYQETDMNETRRARCTSVGGHEMWWLPVSCNSILSTTATQ